jgi:hypothetical protein
LDWVVIAMCVTLGFELKRAALVPATMSFGGPRALLIPAMR